MGGKRIMGLPLYVWLGVAAGGLLLGIYLRRKGSSSGTAAAATSYPISVPGLSDGGSIDNGIAGGGLATGPTVSALDPSTLNDLLAGLASHTGAEQVLTEQTQGLTDAIGSLVFSMPSSAGSGSSAAGNGNANPVTNTPTKPVAAKKAPAKKPAPAKPKAITPIHYFTYKKDVPLKKGQTLHFATGKGYYGG